VESTESSGSGGRTVGVFGENANYEKNKRRVDSVNLIFMLRHISFTILFSLKIVQESFK
jgi:hypothetical protein